MPCNKNKESANRRILCFYYYLLIIFTGPSNPDGINGESAL